MFWFVPLAAADPLEDAMPVGTAAVGVRAPLALSLQEALDRATRANPEILAAAVDVNSADAAFLAARARFEPRLTASTRYGATAEEGVAPFGHFSAENVGWSADLALSQELATGTDLSVRLANRQDRYSARLPDLGLQLSPDPWYASSLTFTLAQRFLEGGRLSWNLQDVRAARGARSVAEAERQATRQEVLAGTAVAWWALRTQAELVAVARQSVEAMTALPAEARVEAARVRAERALAAAQADLSSAQDALLLRLGDPPGTAVEAVSPVEALPPSLDPDRVAEAVLQGNAELVALRIRLDTLGRAAADAKHGLLPSLTGTASYGLSGYETSLAGAYAEMGELPAWSVGANLALPLGNRADRGALGQAEAAAAKAELDLRAREGELARDARALTRVIADAARDMKLTERGERLAEATLAEEHETKDVIDAIEALYAARVEAVRSRSAWRVALVELLRLEGRL